MKSKSIPRVSQFSGKRFEGKYISVDATIYNRREAMDLADWLLLEKTEREQLASEIKNQAMKLPIPKDN